MLESCERKHEYRYVYIDNWNRIVRAKCWLKPTGCWTDDEVSSRGAVPCFVGVRVEDNLKVLTVLTSII